MHTSSPVVIGVLAALQGRLVGVSNALDWSAVVIYLLLTVGLGYFQLRSEINARK